MDPAQGDMPRPMPDALCVLDAPRWLSLRRLGERHAWASSWRVLRRLLLGPDDAVAGGRRDEPALDRPPCVTHSLGEGHFLRSPDRAPCRHSSGCGSAEAPLADLSAVDRIDHPFCQGNLAKTRGRFEDGFKFAHAVLLCRRIPRNASTALSRSRCSASIECRT